MYILGIETSCDETAVAVLKTDNDKLSVLSSVVNSQIKIHKKYGGVVPEVAAREHMKNMLPILEMALEKANVNIKKIDLIAVTQGPGLATSLMVGLETAKSLAFSLDKPLIPINHLVGHNWSSLLPDDLNVEVDIKNISFPFITLLISGGHTELILVKDFSKFELLGRTLDDAVGEAFDKVAKMMKLPYPGGPEISKTALKGDRNSFKFPRPMINSDDLNFSFAGLKTAVLYELKKIDDISEGVINNISASFEAAAVEVLIAKTIKAAENNNVKDIVVAGGVSANKYLRQEFEKVESLNINFPDLQYTGDNAAMIALASYFIYKDGSIKNDYKSLKALPNLKIA